jgi:ubiquinone/menaquinone biosynthesis C-methylase UbiE
MSGGKDHWENIYSTKLPDQVSWTQGEPQPSLNLIIQSGIPFSASIIDIGGGDSNLVDRLLDHGFINITVLDISKASLDRAALRLSGRADKVTWIESNVLDSSFEKQFDVWHDRAAFHFLRSEQDINKYKELATRSIITGGHLILGTFSTNGPTKCSGLEITQYSEESMTRIFDDHFEKIACQITQHTTPFNTKQEFIFCHFRRK